MEKIEKVHNLGKVDWHNLLEQFSHISTTNYFNHFQEKTAIFKNCNFFGQGCFFHQVFAYYAYILTSFDIAIYLYMK